MRNKGRKRFVLIILALLIGTGTLFPACAELFPDDDEMSMVHWGMAGIVRIMAKAVDKPEMLSQELYEELLRINVMNPDKAFIVLDSMSGFLDAGCSDKAIQAVTEAHGIPYSEEMNNEVRQLDTRIDTGKTGLENSLVILGYGPDISLTYITGESVRSTLLTGGEGLGGALTREDAQAIASCFDSEDARILAYEGDSLEKLLTLDSTVHGENVADYIWSTGIPSAKDIMTTVCASEERIRALFSKIAGEPRMDQEVAMKGLFEYLIEHYNLENARMAAEELIPLFEGDGSARFMDFVRGIIDKDLQLFPAPEIQYTEGEEQPLKEGATYLVVAERLNAEGDPVTGCDMVIESALPAAAIPATAEEADYIIRITADWNGGKYTQGNLEVYYANVKMGVYDARTGALVKNLGSYTQKLTGYMTVSSRVTYLNPYRDLIWARIAPLF